MKKQRAAAGKRPSVSDNFSKTKMFLKAVSEENRMRIMMALKGDAMNVTEIHTKLKLPQNLTSHHLSRLKSAGLLNEKHQGTFRLYSLNTKNLKQYGRMLKQVLGL